MDQAAALKLVYDAIDTANDLRREEDKIPKTPDVKLVGPDGRLDSLALATLLLTIERRMEEETGEGIYLLEESAHELDTQLEQLETPEAMAALIVRKLAR